MGELADSVCGIHGRIQQLVEEECKPNLQAAHRAAEHASKLLAKRITTLPSPYREACLYAFYEELLTKTAELQTVIDVMTGKCEGNSDFFTHIQRHVDAVFD